MLRRFLGAALAVAAWSSAYSPASAAPMNCAAASSDVERAICAQPDLLARDRAISVRLDQLKQQCRSARKLLAEGQKFWLRERWDCRNTEGAFETAGVLNSCLSSRMDERLRRLESIGPGCDFTPLVASYRFVDIGYMQRFSDSYLGKRVSVFGGMDLASCNAPRAPATAATIVGKDRKRDRFRVKFSAMPPLQREFLCNQRPAAHWNGTIEHDSRGNYLYLTDVLGQELPVSKQGASGN